MRNLIAVATALFAFSFVGCGNQETPPPPAAPPAATPTASSSSSSSSSSTSIDADSSAGATVSSSAFSAKIFDWIPEDCTVAAGIRPALLASKEGNKKSMMAAEDVIELFERASLDVSAVDTVMISSNADRSSYLVYLRSKSGFSKKDVAEKIGATEPIEEVGKNSIQSIADHPDLGVCFLDSRTVLMGLKPSIKNVLQRQEVKDAPPHPLVDVYNTLKEGSHGCWLVATDDATSSGIARSFLPLLSKKDLSTITGLALSISITQNEQKKGNNRNQNKKEDKDDTHDKLVDVVVATAGRAGASRLAFTLNESIQRYIEISERESEESERARQNEPPPPPDGGSGGQDGRDRRGGGGGGYPGTSSGDEPDSTDVGDSENFEEEMRASQASMSSSYGQQRAQRKEEAKNVGETNVADADGKLVRVLLRYDDVKMGPTVAKVVGISRGRAALGDGIFSGPLGRLASALSLARGELGEDMAGLRIPKNAEIQDPSKTDLTHSFSWLCNLLPYIGHQDTYQSIDFKVSWLESEDNFETSKKRIPEFLNPAAPIDLWQGFPYHGVALTHFVGMSGVEDGPNETAALLPRDHPKAGIFGYDRMATNKEITDGLSKTIMLVGAEGYPGIWIQGGGSTIRGARKPLFHPRFGFGSAGVAGGGAFVLMADGTMRVVSKDIDPKVFRAMCTTHGGETVDLKESPEQTSSE